MKSILLSIKPRFANDIYSHMKSIELRKRAPNVPRGTPVYMYETLPIGMVTGVFVFTGCIVEEKKYFWKHYGTLTCVTEEEFNKYYEKSFYACGWVIGKVVKFEKADTLEIFNVKKAPQSYAIVYPKR